MYKTAAKNLHFQKSEGSSSNRIKARGFGESNDPIEILPSLKEQYDTLQERLKNTQDRVLRADLIRQIGHYRLILEDGTRLAFEKIFINVAQARLPRDKFLVLVEEARSYWRKEGFADCQPEETQRQKHKQLKKNIKYGGARD